MRIVWSVLITIAAGCAESREKPPTENSSTENPPTARVAGEGENPNAGARMEPGKTRVVVQTRGSVQEGLFSVDGQAFLGWVAPLGNDPAAEQQKPKPWVLWSVADGKEIARWTGNPVPGFDSPGTSDGTVWPVHLSEPPKFVGRRRFLDLTTGIASDVPGVPGPTDSCTCPSYSSDRTRLAYSNYARDASTGRVFEKTAAGWKRIIEVPGEKAALSPDGKLVATVARKEDDQWTLVVRLFTVAGGKERWASKVDSYGLHGFTPDGRYVIQNDNAGHRLFDIATGQQMVLVANGPRGDSKGPNEVAYRDGWVAAVVRADPFVEPVPRVERVRWDVAAGKEVSRTKIDSPYGRNRTPPFSSPRLPVAGPIERQPVPGQRGVFRSSMTVDVYDPAAADPLTRLTISEPNAVIASPDGGTLAAVGYGSLTFHPLPAMK